MRVPNIFCGKDFSDFFKSRKIPEVSIQLFKSPKSRYDVIIGRDILAHGFVLDHVRHSILWDRLTVEMAKAISPASPLNTSFCCTFSAAHVYADSSTKIIHAKCDKASPTEVVSQCAHLSSNDESKLLKLLSQFSCLFSGSLGRYMHMEFSISLKDPNVTPIFCNPYPMPLIHQQVSQQELQHLIDE